MKNKINLLKNNIDYLSKFSSSKKKFRINFKIKNSKNNKR